MPRLYREAPLNGIWEGSGNVICLDVLRAVSKTPVVLEVFFERLNNIQGESKQLDQRIHDLKEGFHHKKYGQYQARYVTEEMAIILQAALLIQHGHPAVRNAFLLSRIDNQWGRAFGTLPAMVATNEIINRAWQG